MPSRRPVLQLFVLLLMGFFVLCSDSYAQNSKSKSAKQTKKEPARKAESGDSSSTSAEVAPKTADKTQNKEQEKREQAVTIGTILLIGVLILGFFMISLILILGRRTRRIAKSKGPKQTVFDPLWYLKSRKKEESISPTDGQNGSDHFDSTQS